MPGCSGPRGLCREGRYAEGQQVVSSWVPVCPVRISGVRCRYGGCGRPGSIRTGALLWSMWTPYTKPAGIRDAEDLPAPVEIAQSAEGRTGPAALHAHPDAQAARLVNGGGTEAASSMSDHGRTAPRTSSAVRSRTGRGRVRVRGPSRTVRAREVPRTVSSSATAAPSEAQVRRGCPLHTLADADRQLAAAAVALGTTADELVRRTRAAGFEALLKARVQARVQPPQRPRITQETSVTRGSHSGNGREIASCEAALQRPDRRPQHRSTRKGWLP